MIEKKDSSQPSGKAGIATAVLKALPQTWPQVVALAVIAAAVVSWLVLRG